MSSPSPTPSNDHKDTDDEHQSSSEPPTDENLIESKEKGKETTPADTTKDDSESSPSDPTSSSTSPPPASSTPLSAGAWQAIFSPQHNAYYFYNSSTGETTWVNPLQATSSATQDAPAGENSDGQNGDGNGYGNDNPNPYDPNSLEARAIAAGIDPSLAYLDPSLVAGPSSLAPTGAFTAKFNARTGAFAATNARAPSHLSEYERMKRMSEFYFDMNAWEKEVEQRDEAEKEAGGKKRKRPTKKDLDRFKEQKRLKKIAKTAWLRT